jgi:hypothetical protein
VLPVSILLNACEFFSDDSMADETVAVTQLWEWNKLDLITETLITLFCAGFKVFVSSNLHLVGPFATTNTHAPLRRSCFVGNVDLPPLDEYCIHQGTPP